jgi:hypothetical protein
MKVLLGHPIPPVGLGDGVVKIAQTVKGECKWTHPSAVDPFPQEGGAGQI